MKAGLNGALLYTASLSVQKNP